MTTQINNANPIEKARETRPPSLIAYHIAERGAKKFWTRIGAAWDHEDTRGLTLDLELIPATGGRIVLREPQDDTARHGESA